ncbi:MAG: EF-P lysine aminoacylase EpmA [Pseudomonadales bacterium]|nr:EF-P lysine aminoacylase EpmA [Pseudomonadales bacterium]NRA14998.1 EF-P lysine aminoacylase GenX [Oceanospirillaceae bacterium]
MNTDHWQPSATLETLKKRAAMLAQIRDFFSARDVLEVDVPVLSQAAVCDPYIDSLTVEYRNFPEDTVQHYYLQSSPEYAMKRLLAAGSGCIYQMSKVFRNGEVGSRHNPEFTMLEWYRLGLDDQTLMDEVAALVTKVTGIEHFQRYSYRQLFLQYLNLDINTASDAKLAVKMREQIEVSGEYDRDGWLNLLMSHCIEPQLQGAVFVYHYPASQSALARLTTDADGFSVAARFELFIEGVELANGYHELTDAAEQAKRFAADQQLRSELGLQQRPLELRLVEALKQGLPDCAGVALGVDRLLMLALAKEQIAEVLPFDFSRA